MAAPLPRYNPLLIAAQQTDDNYIAVNKFGRNPDVDIGTEDIWAAGGTWMSPSQARVHDIASSDVNDSSAGTGCQTIMVAGLDENYNLLSENVIMNGTTNVPTVNAYTIVYRMTALTAGTGGTNAGIITATAQVDGTVTVQMNATLGQSQIAVYQVPAGYTGYVLRYGASTDGNGGTNVEIDLMTKPLGGVYNLRHSLTLRAGGSSGYAIDFSMGIKVVEKSIIKLRATADGNNNDVSGSFDVFLLKN